MKSNIKLLNYEMKSIYNRIYESNCWQASEQQKTRPDKKSIPRTRTLILVLDHFVPWSRKPRYKWAKLNTLAAKFWPTGSMFDTLGKLCPWLGLIGLIVLVRSTSFLLCLRTVTLILSFTVWETKETLTVTHLTQHFSCWVTIFLGNKLQTRFNENNFRRFIVQLSLLSAVLSKLKKNMQNDQP